MKYYTFKISNNTIQRSISYTKTIIWVAILLVLPFLVQAQEYELVWSDEFTDGMSTDWSYDIGGHGWGNNELQYYTNSNTSVSDGTLKITVKKEAIGNRLYTSSRIKTQGAKAWKYGKIEARIKIPKVQGNFPAFWLLGDIFNGSNWPQCGEIDIMEQINTEDIIHANVHYDNNGYKSNGKGISAAVADFHVYAVDWDEKAIRFLLDGNQYHQVNIENSINGTEEFHHEHFIILNYAMGGNWPGFVVNENELPSAIEIDYVRVYQKKSTTDIFTESLIPNEISISQAYPNPFNPATNLNIYLPQSESLSITVYNTLGQIVNLQSNLILNQGNNVVPINGSKWNSGMYFIVVQTKTQIFMRKIHLIK